MVASHGNKSIIWHTASLPRATQKALEYLGKAEWLKKTKWYLAGGTALALQAGHRTSVDLDFFIPKKEFSSATLLAHFSQDIWEGDIVREGTIYGKLCKAKVSFIAYPFFIPARPFARYGAVRVLTPPDIAVMKIIAISQRGRKRDFVDLYWLCKNLEPLEEIVYRLPAQYPTVAHNYHHIIKSLTYFADAEGDPMPELHFDADWKTIKKFFQTEGVRVARKVLRLR